MSWPLFEERYRDLIPDFDNFLLSLEDDLPIGLRINQLKATGDKFLKDICLKEEISLNRVFSDFFYYEVDREKKYWGGKLEHHLGLYYMQALSSLLPVYALDPKPNDSVLDMCSAPGGKSALIAELMNSKGPLICNEPDLNRRRILKANLERMGVRNAATFDALGESLPFKDQTFDKILLDGPCSSEGTLRKVHLGMKKRKLGNFIKYNKEFRLNLQRTQFSLLSKAVSLLRPGGTLVYSTCTYDPDENEGQVDKLLNEFPQMKLTSIELPHDVQKCLEPGREIYQGVNFDKSLKKTCRVYPHRLNSIGFYFAKFIKHN